MPARCRVEVRSMSLIDRPLAYAQTNASRFVAELRQIVSSPPSVPNPSAPMI